MISDAQARLLCHACGDNNLVCSTCRPTSNDRQRKERAAGPRCTSDPLQLSVAAAPDEPHDRVRPGLEVDFMQSF